MPWGYEYLDVFTGKRATQYYNIRNKCISLGRSLSGQQERLIRSSSCVSIITRRQKLLIDNTIIKINQSLNYRNLHGVTHRKTSKNRFGIPGQKGNSNICELR